MFSQRSILLVALALVAYGQQTLAEDKASANAVPKQESAKLACTTAKGATKTECEKVAAKVDANTANPSAPQTTDATPSSGQEMHHSGPAMRTPAEVTQDEQAAKQSKKPNQADRSKAPAPRDPSK